MCFTGTALMAALTLMSCTEESDALELDEDGLTADVRELIPYVVIDGLKEVGHPIYGGTNPPDLTGSYLMDPLVFTSTNLPGDTFTLGTVITSQSMVFSDQSSDLALAVSFTPVGRGTSHADRSFIVGDDCRFTVFSEYAVVTPAGSPWSNLMVFSGCLSDAGIEDAAVTYVLLADRDEIFLPYREPGQGRTFTDGNGLAEREQ